MSPSLLLTLSLRKLALRSSHTLGIRTRMLSSSSISNNPYLLYLAYQDTDAATNTHYFDPVKEDELIVRGKVFPRELQKGLLSGISHGYAVMAVDLGKYRNKAVYFSDYFSPWSSKTNPKIIPLTSVWAIKGSQVDLMTNAAMTCSPDQSKDFAVAVSCFGSQVNFSRPGGDLENSDLFMKAPHFRYYTPSKIMYSKRDHRFYIPGVEGHFLVSWDANFENQTGSKAHELRFSNLPELTQSEWELLDSCSSTVQFVESPSGQRFLIKWYAEDHKPGEWMTFLCRGTKQFMVFREEEEMNMCYTEDIGDLCIFLGNNEPFCLKASSFPGLNPNSIYFAGDGYGVYDIATRKPRSFRPKYLSAFSEPPTYPYWIPPMSL